MIAELRAYRGNDLLLQFLIPPGNSFEWRAGPSGALREVTTIQVDQSNLGNKDVIRSILYGLGWLSGAVERGPDREMVQDFTERLIDLAERMGAS
jgi:hypothetical protein